MFNIFKKKTKKKKKPEKDPTAIFRCHNCGCEREVFLCPSSIGGIPCPVCFHKMTIYSKIENKEKN